MFGDTRLAPLWAIIRLYVGYEWLVAGWGIFTNPAGAWVGKTAGSAVTGLLNGALTKTTGEHPDVQGYYAWFINQVALPNASLFSYLVTFGEIIVGIALRLIYRDSRIFWRLYERQLLARTVSTNPLLFIFATLLVLAWRTAGFWGLDRWVLGKVGIPGYPGPLTSFVKQ